MGPAGHYKSGRMWYCGSMMDGTKRCSNCLQDKPVGEYHKNRARVDGYATMCRACQREKDRERRARYSARGESEIYIPAQQRCGECAAVKPAAAFSRNRGKRSGLSNSCRQCKTLAARGRRAKNAARMAFVPVPEKKCSRCSEVKSAGEFALCRGAACGLQGMCRDCSRQDAAERRRGK